jgi:hypothetical protein
VQLICVLFYVAPSLINSFTEAINDQIYKNIIKRILSDLEGNVSNDYTHEQTLLCR